MKSYSPELQAQRKDPPISQMWMETGNIYFLKLWLIQWMSKLIDGSISQKWTETGNIYLLLFWLIEWMSKLINSYSPFFSEQKIDTVSLSRFTIDKYFHQLWFEAWLYTFHTGTKHIHSKYKIVSERYYT